MTLDQIFLNRMTELVTTVCYNLGINPDWFPFVAGVVLVWFYLLYLLISTDLHGEDGKKMDYSFKHLDVVFDQKEQVRLNEFPPET